MTKTSTDIENIALSLGLGIAISVKVGKTSGKLGPQVEVIVSGEGRVWRDAQTLGRAIGEALPGKIFLRRADYYEIRSGVYGGCNGYREGTRAILRYYPEA